MKKFTGKKFTLTNLSDNVTEKITLKEIMEDFAPMDFLSEDSIREKLSTVGFFTTPWSKIEIAG